MSSDQELSGAEDESLIEDEENPAGVNMFELNAEEINALDQYRLEPKYFVTYFIHFFIEMILRPRPLLMIYRQCLSVPPTHCAKKVIQ